MSGIPKTCRSFLLALCLTIAVPAMGQERIERMSMPDPSVDRTAFIAWQNNARSKLRKLLGIPVKSVPLEAKERGSVEVDGIVIEKWVLTLEPGSKTPAIVYRPNQAADQRLPAVVLTFGHGASKSHPCYNYIGQLLAKCNIVCLAMDPIGEEERHQDLRRGTRAHDPQSVHELAWKSGRPIMGKLVFDTIRGVDFLRSRSDVDPERIGVAGNSLGGAKAGWMAALDTRLKLAVVSGWAFAPAVEKWGKFCTRVPNENLRRMLSWHEFLSLAAPHCSILVANGKDDDIIDRDRSGKAWRDTDAAVNKAAKVYAALSPDNRDRIKTWYEPGGGHRPYPAHPEVLAWICHVLKPPGWTAEKVKKLGHVNFGKWAEANDVEFEKLYGTQLHLRGATVAEMGIRYLKPSRLRVLKSAEIGKPEFTIEGWLDHIKKSANSSVSKRKQAPGSVQRVPEELQKWLKPQAWKRDTTGPILSLGKAGDFDDTHIFAPAVIRWGDRYWMWYCGSRGKVQERVFRVGVATSSDGREFARHDSNPVLKFGDGKRSVLTPTLLRSADGSILKENDRLRMWLSATSFTDPTGLHTLHESFSKNGIDWSDPSGPLLKHVYAPTIIKDGQRYLMWYTDVEPKKWVIRFATSDDGKNWNVVKQPVIQVDQDWESDRLFYPAVVKVGDVFLMWYGSYWSARKNTTAIGFAVSLDGKQWRKHPHNPVLRPEIERSWESHYVTSQSIVVMPDGSFRIWYASRKKPPFVNKYFAINTATWVPKKHAAAKSAK